MKKLLLLTLAIATLTSMGYSQNSPTKKNGWETDNLRGKVKSYTQSSYDSAERFGEIQEIQKIDGSLFNKETYKYDTKGNLIERSIRHYTVDSFSDKKTYKYDAKGNRIEANGFRGEGNGQPYEETYQYDAKGNLIYTFTSLFTSYNYKYDDNGNLIEGIVSGDEGGPVCISTYKYDDNGNTIEENNYNPDGSLISKITFEYDDKGNYIERNSYDTEGSFWEKETFKYKFDEEGNWIKRITFKNQIPESIEEREYEYYE